ncbi:MAG: thermonuclease family protein, partial [Methylococcaceae bacterium]|nr:thermonuclease family protein [Methylococcaceae bacterium]
MQWDLTDLGLPRTVKDAVDTVGKVWVNGLDANLEQVKHGMAWVYEKYASDPAYFAAERTAKNARIGLWNQPSPTPPWIFRHPERAGSSM